MKNILKFNLCVLLTKETFSITCDDKTTINDLKKELAKRYEVSISNLKFLVGKARTILQAQDSTLFWNSEIETDDTVYVEIVSSSSRRHSAEGVSFDQVADPNGLVMVRRSIPADNSCLFASIAYAMENKNLEASSDLRRVVASHIASDPQKYNKVVLEMSNKEYQRWIIDDSNWGGAIEIGILSKFYKVEICIIDAQNLSSTIFGNEFGFKKRIYLLYNGSHYDVIVRNISEDMDEETDITTFNCQDKYAFDGAMMIAKEVNYHEQSIITRDDSKYEEKEELSNKKQGKAKNCSSQAGPSKWKKFFKMFF